MAKTKPLKHGGKEETEEDFSSRVDRAIAMSTIFFRLDSDSVDPQNLQCFVRVGFPFDKLRSGFENKISSTSATSVPLCFKGVA
jgi:hypothetical protein